MDTITIIDTSISTDNLGDEIIMDAVNETLFGLFPNAYVFRVPSHDGLSDRAHKFIRKSRHTFVGGTNLLSSKINAKTLWRLRWRDTRHLTDAICLGVGWNDYSPKPAWATRLLLQRVLSGEHAHSVRDSYTQAQLATTGRRSLMTSCVTMWGLTPEHCRAVPARKAPDAAFTLTAWRPDPAADRAFVALLQRHYRQVSFFPQMQDDFAYFQSLNLSGVRTIPPTVPAYNRFLDGEDVDVVGTRLHGGVRALQRRKRALILGIDNRSAEISKDTGLPVVPRGDTAAVERWIEAAEPTDIRLPHANIEAWKAQFGAGERARAPVGAPVEALAI